MGNRYLVVSDLHLADVEDNADGWKAFKGSRHLFDDDFAELVADFAGQGEGGDPLTLVLNGDIFDFDLVAAVPDDPPWPVSRSERKVGLDATEEKSAWKLELMIQHHAAFLDALVRFMAHGHKVVYVLGNHDRELHFEAVQQVFVDALERRARHLSLSLTRGAFAFEPWFFYVPNEIYAEHGHQYDYYSSFRHQLHPEITRNGTPELALPMGNLSNRLLMNRMGYFNPFAGDFILNIFAYILHWFRFYAFSKRSILFPWFFGSLAVIRRSLRMRRALRATPPAHTERVTQVGRRFDLTHEEIHALGDLQRQPITQRFYRLVRELWIDRLIIALLMTGGTIALALVPIPLWIKLMVPLSSFPLLYFIYETLARGESIFTIEEEFPKRARAVSRTLPARAVVFGHTHKPRLIPLSKDTCFVDTGTWAQVYHAGDQDNLMPGLRNYLIVTFDRDGHAVRFGSLVPEPGEQKPPKNIRTKGKKSE